MILDLLLKLCLLPYYLVLWTLGVTLWLVRIIFTAFLSLLLGPLPCAWHKRRRRHRYW